MIDGLGGGLLLAEGSSEVLVVCDLLISCVVVAHCAAAALALHDLMLLHFNAFDLLLDLDAAAWLTFLLFTEEDTLEIRKDEFNSVAFPLLLVLLGPELDLFQGPINAAQLDKLEVSVRLRESQIADDISAVRLESQQF